MADEYLSVQQIQMVSDLFVTGIGGERNEQLPFPAFLTKSDFESISYYLQFREVGNAANISGKIFLMAPDGSQRLLNDIYSDSRKVIGGELKISELPPGRYTLKAVLFSSELRESIHRQFSFDLLEQHPPISEAELFGALEDIETFFGKEISDKLSKEVKDCGAEALNRFWQSFDIPNAEQLFYRRLAIAREKYWLGSAGQGKPSDRGKIMLRYGEPDEVLYQENPINNYAVEIWRYRDIGREFVFRSAAPVNRFDLVMLVKN
ncbi:MAG: hypothetical protein Kow0037_15930 [Calditrichia bacterium]